MGWLARRQGNGDGVVWRMGHARNRQTNGPMVSHEAPGMIRQTWEHTWRARRRTRSSRLVFMHSNPPGQPEKILYFSKASHTQKGNLQPYWHKGCTHRNLKEFPFPGTSPTGHRLITSPSPAESQMHPGWLPPFPQPHHPSNKIKKPACREFQKFSSGTKKKNRLPLLHVSWELLP